MDGNTEISPEFRLRTEFTTLYSISKPLQVHDNYAYIDYSRHTCCLIATHKAVKSVITGITQKYTPEKEDHVLEIYGYVFIEGTVYPKKNAHGFVMLCFVVVMQSFIMNSHEVFIHIHQGCFAGTGTIVRLPQCQWSKLDGYGKISQCITTTKHSKAKTVCIFLGIYCMFSSFKFPYQMWHQLSIDHTYLVNAYHSCLIFLHGDVIKWKHFPRYWDYVRGIHRSPVNSPHKG